MLDLLLFVLIGLGAVLAFVAALVALGAYLRYRHARAELQNHLTVEVEKLARRTGELERGASALQARAARLPITISELQHSLSTLQILSGALASSLRQAQRVLSYSALESLRRSSLGKLLPKTGDGDTGRSS